MAGPPLPTRTSIASPDTGAGCLTLFALPFAGVGLFALWVALQKYLEGAPARRRTSA